ncbi:uncharacterized protein LAESUDRAFT_711809 [Laetiporus sulphureus 93-53]|uniref:Uncharacterized protein n=1 Tax=Laetiporus sulphureus 93-53 TaxID=1314785 RepID=A0A165G7V1_9APHY|nr:uncharacterized protein LAESUDRAFT_711809 [Laetiporus sulphureus 93-53]KZT09947.1 hypothetical protein LAESUDRAFT_711809 [Laetiporus sulphureus 93-53]
MTAITPGDVLRKQVDWAGDILGQMNDGSAMIEAVSFMIRKIIFRSGAEEMQGGSLDDFAPVKERMGVRLNKFTNAVACIECAGEDSSEEEIIIATRSTSVLREGEKMKGAERKFAVNGISASLPRTSYGRLHERMSTIGSESWVNVTEKVPGAR